ncbi:hypothetical protein GCM10010339_69250 [Streptomyces alanosinicus]|uniref:Uncharacterized protein n=1 Tax=Streptomyces alanosinicus TaxID=68171 RepID=A0A918YRG3_9ACTN|nr:hypothetical protein GCM10010339_69250 [Streptomyces alanosinicus]
MSRSSCPVPHLPKPARDYPDRHPQPDDVVRLAQERTLPDTDVPDRAYAKTVLEHIARFARVLAPQPLVRTTAPSLLAVLRHAESLRSGYQQLLIGYAAANLDAAMWIDTHSDEGRLRLATALDYLHRAVDLEPDRQPGP